MSLAQFGPLVGYRDKFLSNNIKYSLEVREYLKDIAELETEFSKKLDAVCRKYSSRRLKNLEKRARTFDEMNTFSGTAPTSHDEMWNRMIQQCEVVSKTFGQLAEANNTASASIKQLAASKDDERKRFLDYFVKLQDNQDQVIQEVDKSKSAYFDAATAVEVAKGKHTAAVEPKLEKKLRDQWNDAILDCNNAKNEYLLQIAGANSVEEATVNNVLPRLIHDMEDLGSLVLHTFRDIMNQQISTRVTYTQNLLDSYKHLGQGESLLDVDGDSKQFLSKASPLPCASGKIAEFSSCIQWNDPATIKKDAAERIYLQNVAFKLEKALTSADSDIALQQRNIENIRTLFGAYCRDRAQGDPESAREKFYQAVKDISFVEINKARLGGEMNLIINELGEFDSGALPHDFKPKSFAIPSSCNSCSNNLWELGKGGLYCTDCGYKIHNKCELKCALNCTSPIRKSKKLAEFRKFVERAPPVQFLTSEDQSRALENIKRLQSKAILNVVETTTGEAYPSPISLTASPAQTTTLPLSPSSMNLSPSSNQRQSPLKQEFESSPTTAAPMIPVDGSKSSLATRRQSIADTASKNPGKVVGVALYDYTGAAGDELDVCEGDCLVVRQVRADGWLSAEITEGPRSGKKGLIPASYVEMEETVNDLKPGISSSLGFGLNETSKRLPSYAVAKDARYATIRSVLLKDPSWLDEAGNEINKEAIVLFDYDSTADDDITIKTDQKVWAKSTEQDGWIYISDGEKDGYVPASYIQIK